jgi:hypothetical protein
MAFTLVIEPRGIRDVQKAIDYYDGQQAGLGERFERALNKRLLVLEKNPFFSLPLRSFPLSVGAEISLHGALYRE